MQYKNINNNIVVIPNGVNMRRFDAITTKKNTWLHILWVGRMSWEKWLKYLIEAISLIWKEKLKKENIHFNLVGDWEEKQTLIKKIKRYDLDNYIHLKWRLEWNSLIEEYKNNHIFVLPSLSEWQPLTILEAFAAKLPIIATDVWDNKYFINDKNWILIPSKNSLAIKDAMNALINKNKEDLRFMGENWYTLIKNNNTWGKIAEKTYDIYCRLLHIID